MEINVLERICELCEKSGTDLSLLSANHKEQGWIKICKDCWIKLYAGNQIIAGSSSSNISTNSPCDSCPGCSYR